MLTLGPSRFLAIGHSALLVDSAALQLLKLVLPSLSLSSAAQAREFVTSALGRFSRHQAEKICWGLL